MDHGYKKPMNEQQNNQMITKYGNVGYPLTKKALEEYGQKLAGILKGQTLQLPDMNGGGLTQLTVLSYNGREHKFDSEQNIANIKSCNFIFNVKVANSSNQKIRSGQTGILFMNVIFNNLKFVSIGKMEASFKGADGLDFGNCTPKLTNQMFGNKISQLNLQSSGQPMNEQIDTRKQSYYENITKQITSRVLGKKIPFGKIGVLDNTNLIFQKYADRSHANDVQGRSYPDFSIMFYVRRVEEDLNRGEKPGTRVWKGILDIKANFVNGQLSEPKLTLYPVFQGKEDFSREITPTVKIGWDQLGGSDLWQKTNPMSASGSKSLQ